MTLKVNGLYLTEKEPNAVIAGCVEIFENIWPNPRETIELIENECQNPDSGISWSRAGTVGRGAYQTIRTNRLMDLTYLSDTTDNSAVQNINNLFYTTLLSTSNSYSRRFQIQESFYHENYQLLKYSPGEYYQAHYDSGTDMGRCVSALCYLNDDYEGGELEFTNFKVKIKPLPGMLILFPSNYAYRHIAHPIKSGTKYSLVTWIRDRKM